jgi:hypothetical protein
MKTLENSLDVIILSLAKDDASFATTKRCVDSYLATSNYYINKIFVVESFKNFDRSYNNVKVEVIIPKQNFNYNEFYNIALRRCTAEFVMGPNNDLIIQENCIKNILEEFRKTEDIHSISPIDRKWHRHTIQYFPNEAKLYRGWETSLQMFGCVFCCRRSVFDVIGFLDERFFFFYQDNDYVYSLQRCGLNHGLLTSARVVHKVGTSSPEGDERCRYTPHNMNSQGDILGKKWNSKFFKDGGYKKFVKFSVLNADGKMTAIGSLYKDSPQPVEFVDNIDNACGEYIVGTGGAIIRNLIY